jgi:hypothetical protein
MSSLSLPIASVVLIPMVGSVGAAGCSTMNRNTTKTGFTKHRSISDGKIQMNCSVITYIELKGLQLQG